MPVEQLSSVRALKQELNRSHGVPPDFNKDSSLTAIVWMIVPSWLHPWSWSWFYFRIPWPERRMRKSWRLLPRTALRQRCRLCKASHWTQNFTSYIPEPLTRNGLNRQPLILEVTEPVTLGPKPKPLDPRLLDPNPLMLGNPSAGRGHLTAAPESEPGR